MSCLSPELAVDFVVGALPKGPAAEVEAHMARCHDCRRLIVEIAKAGDAPDTDLDPPIASPSLAIKSNLGTIPGKRSASKRQPTYELRRGLQVGRYTLLYPLGEGGMGSVYAAFDPKLDRRVALKFLRTDLLGTAEQGHRQRLVREARALARLSHPNVVSIYDVAETDGSVFLAMELIDGTNARVWRELGDRSPEQIVKVYVESLGALMAAHEQGIIHRDFKPDNVMVGADGIARVTDFGLARAAMLDADVLLADAHSEGVDWETLTQTGLVLGTPRYMAPEQFHGLANELTDQFSFCLSMYEALYGHYPLGTKTPRNLDPSAPISEQILSPLSKNRVPDSLRRILLKGLSVDPQARWQNTAELKYELNHALDPASHKTRFAAMLGVGLAIAAAAFFFAPSPPVAQPIGDLQDYASEIAALRQQIENSQATDQELKLTQDKILELERIIVDRDRELAMIALLEEEEILKRNRQTATPPLPIRSVERSVTTRLSEVLACYEEHVAEGYHPTITTRVGIGSNGIVRWVAPPYKGNAVAGRCLEKALKRLTFPASDSATTATLFLSFFRLESGLLAVNMRAKTRKASMGQVTVDAKGRILVDCSPNNPLCGL